MEYLPSPEQGDLGSPNIRKSRSLIRRLVDHGSSLVYSVVEPIQECNLLVVSGGITSTGTSDRIQPRLRPTYSAHEIFWYGSDSALCLRLRSGTTPFGNHWPLYSSPAGSEIETVTLL
jgi:hypothetical protein